MGYRSKQSYRANSPEGEAKKLANLALGRGRKGYENISQKDFAQDETKCLQNADIIQFATGKDYLNLKLYPAQECVLRAIYGLPMPIHLLKYKKLLNGLEWGMHEEEMIEAVLVLGARSGKSFLASIIALYEATRNKWQQYLRKGESGYVIVVSTKHSQSVQIIQRNCAQMIRNTKLEKILVSEPTAQEIVFKNNMRILSIPCTSTAGRGLPIICCIFDEVGHFFSEGARADIDVFNSLRPRMVQFPGSKTLLISTPSSKQGLLWDFFKDGFSISGRLTIQASTIIMNPTIDTAFIERERKRDPDSAEREYDAIFADSRSSYFNMEKVDECLTLVGDILPELSIAYFCGIDQSGLSGRDKFALSICHSKDEDVIIDLIRSWDTKNSDIIMDDIEDLKNSYHLDTVYIDRYAGGWVSQALEKLGLEVAFRENLAIVYSNLKSLVISGKAHLPDNKDLRNAFINTTAYYGRNNALSIAHERTASGHADELDAVASAVYGIKFESEVEGTVYCSGED